MYPGVVVKFFGLMSLAVLLTSCSGPELPAPAPEVDVVEEAAAAPEPEVVEVEPEIADLSYTEEELEACFVAWEAEVEALANGVGDDATLRALAWECPSYDAWELGRVWYEYGGSPSLLKAICAFEAESPLCTDPKTLELIA